MSLVRTPAFVLRAYDYGDSSRIFRVYTPDAGVQSLLARGVKQVKSRLRGVLDLFNHVDVTYSKKPGRSLHFPREADLVATYPGMKADLTRLQSFARVARLIQRIALEEEGNPQLFAFLVEVAEAFDHPDLAPAGAEPLRHFASWQVLAYKGYAPEVDRCVACGGPAGTAPAFVIAQGGIACAACAPGGARLSRREYGALQLFLHGDHELAAGWRLEEGEARRLDRLREEFTVYHAGVAPV